MRTPTGRGGLGPLAPYEKLHQELSDYTDNLGLIFKDFDQRLKALEQKAQVQHRWPIACVQLQRGVDRQARHRVAAPTRTAPT